LNETNPAGTALGKPSILVISSALPCRHGTGSEVRAFFLIEAASRLGDVTLVCPRPPSEQQMAALGRSCTRLVFPAAVSSGAHQTRSRLHRWGYAASCLLFPVREQMRPYLSLCLEFTQHKARQGFRRIFGWLLLLHQWLLSRLIHTPPMAIIWKQIEFASVLDELESILGSRHRGFDLIWLETTAAFTCLDRLVERVGVNAPVVLSAHNIEWMIPKRQASDIRDPLLRLATLLQADLMRQFERRAHRTSDLAIHCSSTDAELAKTFAAKTRIVCIGNGVDIEHYKSSPNNVSDAPLIIYTGNFNYQPNIDAAIRLIVDVLPLIRRDVPDVQVLIAGRNAAALADKLPVGLSWLTIVPNPDDMRPLLEQAWITVIPLRSGSGTRLKILEAMAMKVAVISTAIGAEGLEATDGDVLLIRDSAEAQAEAAVRLLQNAQARGELADRACKWVGERFSWDRLVQQTVDEVRPLVTRH
jgi:glycosyltransferase involved in cell wall biosynthesis